MEYTQWEISVTEIVKKNLDITNGDAQGILDANSFTLSQCWCNDNTPQETANKLINI